MSRKRPVLLYACNDVGDEWLAGLRRALPHVDVRAWPQTSALDEIELAFVWKQPAGLLGTLPNLRAVFSLGAGVEHILRDPSLPAHVPLVRMVDPGLVTGMNEYVLWAVLHHHRQMPRYEAQQRESNWTQWVPPLPQHRRVGIMGLGQLGGTCAQALAALGFDVASWSRTPHALARVRTYAGDAELPAFLARTEILVCLLPLTPETENILDAHVFAQLPRAASVINVARGKLLVEEDLIAALDAGQLDAATLDVFREEPLPASHPFWRHPKIRITPHISAVTQIETATATLAANIECLYSGKPMTGVVDRGRGY